MTLAQVPSVPPTIDPVTLAEAKLSLRVDHTAEDDEITEMISAATLQCEFMCGRQFIHATWIEYFDVFPTEIRLARPPLSTITSIQYVDADGATQTWAAGERQVDAISEPARIKPAFGESYPSTRDDYNAVIVTFVAGYGAAASSVPDIYKRAIKLLAGHWYLNREAYLLGTMANEVRDALRALLNINRIMTF